MKIKRILPILGLVLTAGAGLAIGLNSAKQEIKSASATAEGYVTVYLEPSSNWTGKTNAKMYVHWWGSTTEESGGMSANEMTRNDFGIYTYDVPIDATGMVFNVNGWGGDCQTVNLTPDTSKTFWTITTGHTDGTSQSASNQTYSEKTIYVLDKMNSRLQVNHYAHVWKDNSTIGTTWPGLSMSTYSGRIYELSVPSVFNRVQFHNNEGNQTDTLVISNDCSVLEESWDGTKWVSLESAEFIDGYMHFNDISLSNEGETANCAANFNAAKTAYNALSSDSVRLEVLGVNDVFDRLSNWATANGATLNNDGSVISSNKINPIAIVDNKNMVATIIAAGGALLLLVTFGVFFIRRRKFN